MKNTLFIIIAVLVLFSPEAHAETIYPILETEQLQSLVAALNEDKIRISDWYYDELGERVFETVASVNPDGTFFIEGSSGAFKMFQVDINNDGTDEYIKTLSSGSGRFFDIEAIYIKQDQEFRDIYDQIKLELRRLIRDLQGETYDLEEGYVGFMRGDILFENEDGQVVFSLLEGSGQWYDGEKWVNENCPVVYKFHWQKTELVLLTSNKRCLQESDFIPGKADPNQNA